MKLQMMDYSLLLGLHDCELAEQENRERLERQESKLCIILAVGLDQSSPVSLKLEAEPEQKSGAEDSYNEDDDDSGGSTVGVGGATGPTPPDSPQMGRERLQQYPFQYTGKIVPEVDIYAIPCKEGDLVLQL